MGMGDRTSARAEVAVLTGRDKADRCGLGTRRFAWEPGDPGLADGLMEQCGQSCTATSRGRGGRGWLFHRLDGWDKQRFLKGTSREVKDQRHGTLGPQNSLAPGSPRTSGGAARWPPARGGMSRTPRRRPGGGWRGRRAALWLDRCHRQSGSQGACTVSGGFEQIGTGAAGPASYRCWDG